MTFPANISKHRTAVMEMLEESFRDPGKRSVLKTRGISMRPLIRDRDDIVIRSKAIDEICLGELIAYRAGDVLVVHRVVATDGVGPDRLFYEKGDNNMYVTEVAAARILGVIVEAHCHTRKRTQPAWSDCMQKAAKTLLTEEMKHPVERFADCDHGQHHY